MKIKPIEMLLLLSKFFIDLLIMIVVETFELFSTPIIVGRWTIIAKNIRT